VIHRFLDFVEIKTKITSLFAFLITIAWLFYKDLAINWELTSVFFASMFLFDLTTTAVNNYIDTKTNGQKLQFQRKRAFSVIVLLLFVSAALGLYLAYRTDIVVLLLGGLCFLCGLLYTAGPVPISRQPWGEALSGIFYGLLLPFILLYINMPRGTFLTLGVDAGTVALSLQIRPVLGLILFSVLPVCTTANIMLANNICDVERDIAVKRYTLPYYLGKKALYLYIGLYYATYAAAIALVALRIFPPLCLAFLLTIVPVQKNINAFLKKQDKATTFNGSIKNFIIIMGSNTLLIFLSGVLF
jgi:1,4-dihydroxy-2-naphthoate octaprenyltransferase